MLTAAKSVLRTSRDVVLEGWERARYARKYSGIHNNLDPALHVREAAGWLARAQDAGEDRGVSWGLHLARDYRGSYPETTGYIICTFLDLAERYPDEGYLRRAIEMGDWESSIQLDSGAVMGGIVNSDPSPAVFNTGQVLLGWSALLRLTGEDRFRESARRACDWLIGIQEENGDWNEGNSRFARSSATVYNVKAAWGMAEAGVAAGWEDAVASAVRNAEYALTRQLENGWFEDCCLTDPSRPLLHTIAYSMQGLVGIGKAAGRRDFIGAAARTADSLLTLMSADGFLPGRIDASFQGAADWCCLTGTAQTSIVWSELYLLTGEARYREAATLANQYLMARHDISNPNPRLRGGVLGSWPCWGDYGRFQILNWATKFFIDALLLAERAGGTEAGRESDLAGVPDGN